MHYIVTHSMKAIEALALFYPESSKRTLLQWIRSERLLLDNGTVIKRPDFLLEQGQTIRLSQSVRRREVDDIDVLFEDRHFIVINKPHGLLSVPLDGPSTKRHALGLLRKHYQTDQLFAVHRIDRETSGVLLFARGYSAKQKFDSLFENHDLDREYFAILEGHLSLKRGTWECHLKELPNHDVIATSNPLEGKKAITHYVVERQSKKYSYVKLNLETGRKHQIRVHCKMAGCPVLGDHRYESGQDPIHRLCLHARLLSFNDPFTQRRHTFIAPLPFSFKKLVP